VYSPNGRWVAYVSDESGRREVQVRASSGEGGRFIVSTNGGDGPRWAGTGDELFYIGDDGWLWAAMLDLGRDFRVIGRERLFDTAPYDLFTASSYGVHPSGRQFVFVRSESQESAIEVVVNWLSELRQHVRAAD
jgi:serine/threonine-protein kinase